MSLWYYLRRLYSLDTLDTRLTTSSQAPARLVAAGKDISEAKTRDQDASRSALGRPSKWNTMEYYFYYLVVGVAVPMMFYASYTASKGQYGGKDCAVSFTAVLTGCSISS